MFCMRKREIETKTKENPYLPQTRYLLTKLCNIFDDAFLFDVSIVCINVDPWLTLTYFAARSDFVT